MIFKVPEFEHREFNYKPRYYKPRNLSSSGEENISEEEKQEAAMRNRIHTGLHSQMKHHRIPGKRLWILGLILLLLLLVMSRL